VVEGTSVDRTGSVPQDEEGQGGDSGEIHQHINIRIVYRWLIGQNIIHIHKFS